MADLTLNLIGQYFRDIENGSKPFEFREVNAYWTKRLVNRQYDRLVICLGYPKKDDTERRIVLPYDGYELQNITHPHFGNVPTPVFAIRTDISKRLPEIS